MRSTTKFIACAMLGLCPIAAAQSPQLGGPMVHLGIMFDGTNISLMPEGTGPLQLKNYSQT